MPIGDIIQRGINAVKNTKVEIDLNPFDDGKIGGSIQVGKNRIEVKGGSDIIGIAGTAIDGKSQRAAQNIGRGGARTAASARNLGRGLLGAEVSVGRDGVGSTTISAGFGGPKNASVIPGLQLRDADGNLLVDASLIPMDAIKQIGGNIRDILEADANKATNRAYEDYNNRNRKPPQPGTRSRDSVLRPPGTQPGTTSRKGPISQPTSQPRSPSLPGGTAQTIPNFPVQGSAENAAADKALRDRGGGGRLAPEPFQIPTDSPKTNTRLPKKPQIGGSGVQANNRSRSQSGGKSLGGRIARPEDLEDLSPNSPTNKPRINQPSQDRRESTPMRLLTPQEKGLFDCLNNGGGDACYKKFNQQKPSNQSTNSGGANIELEFGDPYIGMAG
jgi:hypothetical protein